MGQVNFPKWDHPTTAFFLKKRWWKQNKNPPGPEGVFVTEDGAFDFETEDGAALFVTEGIA